MCAEAALCTALCPDLWHGWQAVDMLRSEVERTVAQGHDEAMAQMREWRSTATLHEEQACGACRGRVIWHNLARGTGTCSTLCSLVEGISKEDALLCYGCHSGMHVLAEELHEAGVAPPPLIQNKKAP